MKKTEKEYTKEVRTYLDKVAEHVYFNGKDYLIVFKLKDKYYKWVHHTFEKDINFDINESYYVKNYEGNAKNVIGHSLFLCEDKFHSIKHTKKIRKFKESLKK